MEPPLAQAPPDFTPDISRQGPIHSHNCSSVVPSPPYYQGDLILTSTDGYGTDANVYLKALAEEASEMLPVYNKTSESQYDTPRWANKGF